MHFMIDRLKTANYEGGIRERRRNEKPKKEEKNWSKEETVIKCISFRVIYYLLLLSSGPVFFSNSFNVEGLRFYLYKNITCIAYSSMPKYGYWNVTKTFHYSILLISILQQVAIHERTLIVYSTITEADEDYHIFYSFVNIQRFVDKQIIAPHINEHIRCTMYNTVVQLQKLVYSMKYLLEKFHVKIKKS